MYHMDGLWCHIQATVVHVLNMVDHGLTDLVTWVIRSKSSENAENTVFKGPGHLEKCELY